MEEQILLYYLKVFSLSLFIIFLLTFLYSFHLFSKNNLNKNNIINIKQGESFERIIINNFKNLNKIEIEFFKLYYKINYYLLDKNVHYGDFFIDNSISFYDFLRIISKPSNILNKITIVEGWSKKELDNELSKYFNVKSTIEYNDILADTYYFQKSDNFENFIKKLKDFKANYLNNFKTNIFFDKFTEKELLIIGSLIEKEGKDYYDKRNISSVIINRINKNMKLQIDATVLFAITNGNYDLERKLTYNDLKINNPYNTYKIKGLPPKPISFVGTKTIDLILENYKSDYLFYFFDNKLNKHTFSSDYETHKLKLNEYRKKE